MLSLALLQPLQDQVHGQVVHVWSVWEGGAQGLDSQTVNMGHTNTSRNARAVKMVQEVRMRTEVSSGPESQGRSP